MLDCPDDTQISPAQTSFRRIVFDAWTFISNGPPASPGRRWRLQRPTHRQPCFGFRPEKLTETASLAAAIPQT